MDNYLIKYGDTLTGISKTTGVSIDSLVKANKIADPNKIIAGQNLVIPKLATTPTPVSTIQTTETQRNKDNEAVTKLNDTLVSKGIVNTPAPVQTTTPQNTTTPNQNNIQNGNGTAPVAPTPAPVPDMNSTIDSAYTGGVSDPTAIYNDLVKKGVQNVTLQAVTDRIATLNKDPNNQVLSQSNAQLKKLDTDYDAFKTQLDTLGASADAENKAAIASITATFDQRRSQLKDSYTSLSALREKSQYQTDAFRYTPIQAEGLVTNDEQNYIVKLGELDAQEKSALLQAAQAKKSSDFDLLSKKMDLYDKINDDRTNLITKILSVATANNKAIAAEKAIAAKANALPSTASTVALAKAVAPSIRDAVADMSTDDSDAYITEKATALKIPVDVLKGQVTSAFDAQDKVETKDQLDQDKLTLSQQKAADARAKAAAAAAKKGSGKAPTVTQQKNTAYGKINKLLDDGLSYNGTPYLDPNGFFTPQGFQVLVQAALASNITRQEFIKNYAGKFYGDNIDQYGLSAKEQSLILGI